MDKQIAGLAIAVNEEGYLTDLTQWSKEVAIEIAKEEGIELTDKHWTVLDFLQNSFRNADPLSMRSLGKRGPVSIKEFYELFPGGPLKKASRIAGIPKPSSCV
jgi:TusE/DsrC/DsvC family sulfur relay protein